MTTNAGLLERAQTVFAPNVRPAALAIARGEGSVVYDVEGHRYLDLVAGIAVSALGHAHPRVVAAIQDQAAKVLHTSNLYVNEPSVELAEALVELSFGDKIFFANSGAEANEAAIKLARKYAHDRGDKARVEIVTFEGSFHGRTYGAVSATAQPKYHVGFEPIVPGFRYVPFGDLAALDRVLGPTTAAILIEPIQGEGGVRVPPPGFLAALRERADRVGALLVFDEVQTGFGRTGRLFAHQVEGVIPDLMTLAKGLGGGLPVGALVAKAAVAASLTYGSHATTFGGNPVACRAGLEVLRVVKEPEFLAHVERVSERLFAGLRSIARAVPAIREVRGRGLLIGVELGPGPFEAKDVVERCRKLGLLVHIAGPRVVRLVPPLVLTEAEADEALAILDGVFASLAQT